MDVKLTKKQTECWEFLTDNTTTEIVFGGGVAGGKTFMLALWVCTMSLKYPGTRWLVARTVLQHLKLTTLKTILEVLQTLELKSGQHYTYNGQNNVLTFYNGSEIIFKDIQHNPSDINFDSLGSLEITGAAIDEAQQSSRTAYAVIKSRIRYKLTEFNLKPKLLMTCNPGTNYIKSEFFVPFVKGILEPNKKFIQSLVTDNPHISPDYIENLKSLPLPQQKRLLQGNWEYTDEIGMIFEYDSIVSSVFRHDIKPTDQKYMSVDVARFGDDSTVICIWVGLCLIDIKQFKKMDTVEISNEIKNLTQVHGIHPNNVIVDSDGVGGGVADQIRGKNFMNNSSPLNKENYSNLKSQCYVKLSDEFKKGNISINLTNPTLIDSLTQELMSIKLKDVDKDNKIAVMSKDEQKRLLGRSPDFADAMMMRMFYQLKPKNSGRYALAQI